PPRRSPHCARATLSRTRRAAGSCSWSETPTAIPGNATCSGRRRSSSRPAFPRGGPTEPPRTSSPTAQAARTSRRLRNGCPHRHPLAPPVHCPKPERVPAALSPPYRSSVSGKEVEFYGNRNREVVQRCEGVRVHHTRRGWQGSLRASQQHRRRRLQEP